MQRDKLREAMLKRMQRKENEKQQSNQDSTNALSVIGDNIDMENYAQVPSFAAPYLESKAPASLIDAVGSQIILQSQPPKNAQQQDSSISFESYQMPTKFKGSTDSNLLELEALYKNSTASVDGLKASIKPRPVQDQRQTSPEYVIPQPRAAQSFSNRVSVTESDRHSSMLAEPLYSNTAQQEPIYLNQQQVPSRPAIIPPQPAKNVPRAPKPITTDDIVEKNIEKNLITQLQAECQRLQRQLEEKNELPKDVFELQKLNSRMRNEIHQLREEMENTNNVTQQLQQIIQEQRVQISEHETILSRVNEIVTGQNEHFDFEEVIDDLTAKYSAKKDVVDTTNYLQKLKEAAEDMGFMREEINKKDTEIALLKQKLAKADLMSDIQSIQKIKQPKEQKEAEPQKDQQKEQKKSGDAMKQELLVKNQQIEKLNDELNELRTMVMSKQPGVDQSEFYREQIKQLQQINQLDNHKLIVADQEYQKLIKTLTEKEEARVKDMREQHQIQSSDYIKQIDNLGMQMSKLTEENKILIAKCERLSVQFEASSLNEYNRRLNKLEQVPESKYMNDVVERAILAEKTLKDEKEKFEQIILGYQSKLKQYSDELASFLNELQQVV